MRIFVWFSFLYYTVASNSDFLNNDIGEGLTSGQQQQLYEELSNLSDERRKTLLQDLERQVKDFDQSKLKWAKLRQTLPYSEQSSLESQTDVDSIRRTIRSGGNPIVRSKRTLKFLVKSLSEILGLRWTLLKYSLIPAAVNTIIGPPPAPSAAPPPAPAKPPAAPAAPAAPPKRPPPPPRRPPPPPAPAKPAAPAPPPPAPAKPAAVPAAPPARPPPPPTIPPNQIDPNTIRYPFRPAPTIPFLNFAPLPPGVTVPYPPLFQWPSPAASPAAPAIPPQPPCAAPPPAAPPKNSPRPPSILPLPKPRPPVPPPQKPVAPVLPASPGKTPIKLEYDHPVRIEIFNNVKPYLPASGNVYSGEPSLSSLEELDEKENEKFLIPTQAINQIDEQYNTEPAQSYIHDDDYGFLKSTPYVSHHSDDYQTTDISSFDDFKENTKITAFNEDEDSYRDNTERSRYEQYDDTYTREETTPKNHYEESNDYPEVAEENRAHVNIKVKHRTKSDVGFDGYKKPLKKSARYRNKKTRPSASKTKEYIALKNHRPAYSEVSVRVTDSPARIPKKSTRLPRPSRQNPRNEHLRKSNGTDQFHQNFSSWGNGLTSTHKLPFQPYSKLNNRSEKPYSGFRIVVPNNPSRKRRDLLFDDAFKSFNLSAFESFNKEDVPESTQAQFLESNGKLIPNLDYRKKLEKDIEKYIEQYVEQQISNGQIDTRKPKTTIVELKSKDGVPIKTITTTISKLVDGNKPFIESLLDFSKNINPVSNVGEIAGESSSTSQIDKPSEVSLAFKDEPKGFGSDAFSWNFSIK